MAPRSPRGPVNTTRAELLRTATEGIADPEVREKILTTAAVVASLPDSRRYPGDRPLFELSEQR